MAQIKLDPDQVMDLFDEASECCSGAVGQTRALRDILVHMQSELLFGNRTEETDDILQQQIDECMSILEMIQSEVDSARCRIESGFRTPDECIAPGFAE